MGAPRQRWIVLIAVAVVALAVRVAVVAAIRGLPQFEVPILDSRCYLEAGRAWAAGTPLPPRPFFMSPGYTAFVALCARLSAAPAHLAVALQVASDVAAIVAVAALALRWLGPMAGLVAGLLLALHGPQILFTTRLLDATLGSTLVALLAWRLAAVDERPGAARLVGAGLVVGALALLRSTALLFVPLALLRFAWSWRRDAVGRNALRLAAFLLGVALPIVPVTWRNATAGGEAVLLTASGGVNFFIGNARTTDGRFMSLNELPLAPGRFVDDPTDGGFELSIQSFAQQQAGRALTAGEVSSFWFRLATREIAAAPRDWILRLARKGWLFLNAFEIPQVDNVYFLAGYLPAWFAPLAESSRLFWPLAWFGLVALAWRGRELPAASTLLFAGAYAVAITLFFVTDRYRLWITPIAALGGAATADLLCRAWRAGVARGARTTAALVACGVVVNLNPALFEPFDAPQSPGRDPGGWFRRAPDYLDFRAQHGNMAARCLEAGDAPRALAECRAGLALAPDHWQLLYALAGSLLEIDAKADPDRATRLAELDEAIAALRRAALLQPGSGLFGAPMCDALARRFALQPQDLATVRELAPMLYSRGDHARAAAVLDRWIALAPDDPEAWTTLGANRLKLGLDEAAIEAMRTAVAKAPGEAKYAYNLGLALLRAQRFEAAAAALAPLVPKEPAEAARAAAAPPYAEALIGAGRRDEARTLLEGMLARQQNHLGALLTLGELELAEGHADAARALVERALRVNPRSARAIALRGRIRP